MGTVHRDSDNVIGGFVTVSQAASILRNGGVVAVPTETVYGLAACCTNSDAVRMVYATKGRPADNPLIVHVNSIQQAQSIAVMDSDALRLAETFWPGPLTLVLPHRNTLPPIVTCGLLTVAVRMPRHSVMLDLIDRVGEPLVAPSANRSGAPSPTSAQHVLTDYQGSVPVIDGGMCVIGLESTVVRIDNAVGTILRPGIITAADLRAAGCVDVVESTSSNDLLSSPGTRYRHYAPRTPMVLVDSESQIPDDVMKHNTIVLAPYLTEAHPEWRLLTAATLYHELRRADDLGVGKILVLCSQSVIEQTALIDRLRRAAGLEQEDMEYGTSNTEDFE